MILWLTHNCGTVKDPADVYACIYAYVVISDGEETAGGSYI